MLSLFILFGKEKVKYIAKEIASLFEPVTVDPDESSLSAQYSDISLPPRQVQSVSVTKVFSGNLNHWSIKFSIKPLLQVLLSWL